MNNAQPSLNFDPFDRKKYLEWQADIREGLVGEDNLEQILNTKPEKLGATFADRRDLQSFAELVCAYRENTEVRPTAGQLARFGGLNSSGVFSEVFIKLFDLAGRSRFRGEPLARALQATGFSTSNILSALEIYPEIKPGVQSVPRGIWIP